MSDVRHGQPAAYGDRPALTADLGPSVKQQVLWSAAALTCLVVAVLFIFGIVRPYAALGADSPLSQKYVSQDDTVPLAPQIRLASEWGGESGRRTLVLYDTAGTEAQAAEAEVDAIVAANLATHFGRVEAKPMTDYTVGLMEVYDAVIYMGSTAAEDPSPAFHADFMSSKVPILWVGENLSDLSAEDDEIRARFTATYGWDPVSSTTTDTSPVNGIRYKDQTLTRNALSGSIVIPDITDPDRVDVLATTVESGQPWAIRSANLTYIGENPLAYVNETDRYLAFTDLYYDLLAPDTTASRQAALRLEDVDANADPQALRAIADYLHDRQIPYQIAVIPVSITKIPNDRGDSWIGLSLADRPEVVKALRYMQERGGTIVQHGTTHQFGSLDNPYSGDSGADFEFYRAQCSATNGPDHEIEPCRNESHVVGTGRLGPDTTDAWVQRLQEGQQVLSEVGLGEVELFETPHYLASSNAYVAMAEVFSTRYERSHYFAGQLSGAFSPDAEPRDQIFPYTVEDVYGSRVLPENLGNITVEEQNNHARRDPAFLIEGAAANLVVRESTASFFYHPFLGIDALAETIDGIEELGYVFVAATDLK